MGTLTINLRGWGYEDIAGLTPQSQDSVSRRGQRARIQSSSWEKALWKWKRVRGRSMQVLNKVTAEVDT